MKTKIVLSAVIGVLVLLVAYLFDNLSKKKQALKKTQAECEITAYRYNSLHTYMHVQEKISGYYINPSLPLTNKKGGEVELFDILTDSINTLLYVPPSSCSSCNENIFQNLSRTIAWTNGTLKIVCSVSDFNSIIVLSNHAVSEEMLYATDTPLFPRKLFHPLNPCVINITHRGQIKSVFSIDNNDVAFFNDYLKFCRRIFFNK